MTAPERSDFFQFLPTLTEREQQLRRKIQEFVAGSVAPVINDAWERAEFPAHLLPELRALRIAGTTLATHGGPGMTLREQAILAYELSRGDGSINTFMAVHSGLVMQSIDSLGSEEQRDRWLPDMVELRTIGAFALTEPRHGSDAVTLETTAERHGDHFVLQGEKRWIGNGSLADTVLIWARDTADNQVKPFVLEKQADGTYPAGYMPRDIGGKIGKRAVQQADITIRDLRIPAENLLVRAQGFSDVVAALDRTRINVSWSALGHATAAFDIALEYVGSREQFGAPIASYQLVQQQIAQMVSAITAMYTLCFRAIELAESGQLTGPMTSLLKMHTTRASREVCRDARDLLGGNGLLLERDIARHLTDSEVNHTYEGTEFIQALLVGRELTGISAFTRNRARTGSGATP